MFNCFFTPVGLPQIEFQTSNVAGIKCPSIVSMHASDYFYNVTIRYEVLF